MGKEFWLDMWERDHIPFHQTNVDPLLSKHFGNFPKGTVLVPLCGKSLDMKWLLQQHRHVLGVELSEIACEAFFNEHQIDFQKHTQESFEVFKSEKIEIWCGDIFDMPSAILDNVSVIYDRASLVAFQPEIRIKYVKWLSHILESNSAQLLLIGMEYDESVAPGPPYSLPESTIKELFPNQTVNCLERFEDKSWSKQTNSKYANTAFYQAAYHIF